MVLYLKTRGKVIVTVPDHIQRILDNFPTYMEVLAETTAANHMFKVQDYGWDMPNQQQDRYRVLVAKILFLGCQS